LGSDQCRGSKLYGRVATGALPIHLIVHTFLLSDVSFIHNAQLHRWTTDGQAKYDANRFLR